MNPPMLIAAVLYAAFTTLAFALSYRSPHRIIRVPERALGIIGGTMTIYCAREAFA